jgi:hypothetical protein
MRLRIKQGSIHVNSAHYLKRRRGAFVLALDTRAKYPEISSWESAEGGEVRLTKGDGTLSAEATDEETVISLGLSGPWRISATREGRYTVCIYGVRGPDVADDEREIWTDDSDGQEGEGRG